MFTLFNTFRIVAFFEGLSFILLLFFATPYKYIMNEPVFVKWLGMPHGLLFMGYIVLALVLRPEMNWDNKAFTHILIGSLIPFGTFYVDRKYLKPVQS